MNDKDIAALGRHDQALSAAADVAVSMAGYFKALRQEGMTRGEALQMTISYQVELLRTVKK